MSIELWGIISVVTGGLCLFFGPNYIIVAALLASLLPSASALTFQSLGGATAPVSSIAAVFYVIGALVYASPLRAKGLLSSTRPHLWLIVLSCWIVVSFFLGPWLFSGEVFVFTANRSLANDAGFAQRLSFGSAYITQLLYALSGTGVYLATVLYMRHPPSRMTFFIGMIAVAAVNVIAAAVDLVSFNLGIASPIEIFRTGNYALYNDSIAGLKRVSGTFTEASVFAIYTESLFCFCFVLWLNGVRVKLTRALALASFAFLVLSISTTAYLATFVMLVLLFLVAGAFTKNADFRQRLLVLLTIVFVTVPVIAVLVVISDFQFSGKIVELANRLVFEKLSTESGVIRANLNGVAWDAFLDTYFLGVGIGGAAASSFILVVLSNIGIFGAGFFLAFLLSICFSVSRGLSPEEAAFASATKMALFGYFVAACLSARVYDLGILFYLMAGIAASTLDFSSVAVRRPSRRGAKKALRLAQ